jgi:hypothetical protein
MGIPQFSRPVGRYMKKVSTEGISRTYRGGRRTGQEET